MSKIYLAIILSAAASFADAATVTVDFSSFSELPNGVASSGYAFAGSTVQVGDIIGPHTTNGGNVLQYTNTSLSIGRQDGGLFDLVSIDIYQWDLECSGWAYICNKYPYEFEGVRSDNSVVTYTANGLPDQSWSTLTFSDEWKGLTSLTVSGHWQPVEQAPMYGVIDNMVVKNVVPLPAAVWMFMSALTALGFARHRKSH